MCLLLDLLDLLSHTTTPAFAFVLGWELRFWNKSGKHITNESSSWPPEGAVLWLTHVSSVLSYTRSPHTPELLASPPCTPELLADPDCRKVGEEIPCLFLITGRYFPAASWWLNCRSPPSQPLTVQFVKISSELIAGKGAPGVRGKKTLCN